MDAAGVLDLHASVGALKRLAMDPGFDSRAEVLLDLRDIECRMSINNIYNLAEAMAWPDPALPTHRKIAILVDGKLEFDHAKFLAICAENRGLSVTAFDDYDKASEWLNADLPPDPKDTSDAAGRAAAVGSGTGRVGKA
ncbi:MAG: hypothetical protein IPM02_15440 [Betaproteobacteria bacterium]|nr:hypothetical protein [Betaproteobacteria bacterium]